ncbi:hypothetical protein ACHAW5_000401 [Stephanodiscus triporus]|uniref:Uncharacterized protein n=1 Tax=Stephanodiscus triporus TaxID=2934178 RepID=A0ABD3NYN5_9STRA
MVNVTKSNFLTQLADFLHHLPTSSYIAIDEEMTGISLPVNDDNDQHSSRPNKFELPAARYARSLRGVPMRYSILQVGVALFHRNPNYRRGGDGEGGGKEEGAVGTGRGSGRGGPGLGRNDVVVVADGEDDEHAYIHREGMLNQDELEDLTEREEGGGDRVDDEDEDDADDDDAAAEAREEQTEYTSRVYNFYLFPRGGGGSGQGRQQQREMTMNPSTVKFLLENGMDFDKVFREGVPYVTVDRASSMRRGHFEKYDAGACASASASASNSSSVAENGRDRTRPTRPEDVAFVARTMAGLREWIDSDDASVAAAAAAAARGGRDAIDGGGAADVANGSATATAPRREEGTSIVLPPCNAYLRRCLYETIEDEYPGLVLERADRGGEGGGGGGGGGAASAALGNQIRVIRLSPEEKGRREARLRREGWDELLMEMGFATVFQAISDACNGRTFSESRTRDFLDGMCPDLCIPSPPEDSVRQVNRVEDAIGRRIPLVVHNGLHDLMFLLTHCHDPVLPDSFEDTKGVIRAYFPLVFDTKVIGTEYSDAIIKGGRTTLGDLFGVACGDGDPSDGVILPPPTPPAKITNRDGRSQGQAHEAAWDAYMTGCIFGALCNRILESKNRPNRDLTLDRLLHDSPSSLLREWLGLNLIYMHVSLYTIDLESSLGPVAGLHDPLSSGLSIDTTFHVSGITASVSTRDILRALWSGNEGEEEDIRQLKYEIIWVDDSSFFVGTRMADYDHISSAHDSATTGLIASHVRNKLYGGLGGKVDILSLGDYLTKKNRVIDTTDSAGIIGSLASFTTTPFRALRRVLGFGEKRSSDDNGSSGRENKRMRLS